MNISSTKRGPVRFFFTPYFFLLLLMALVVHYEVLYIYSVIVILKVIQTTDLFGQETSRALKVPGLQIINKTRLTVLKVNLELEQLRFK